MSLALVFVLFTVYSKALEPFYYSSIAQDYEGQILDNAVVNVRATIFDETGDLYSETFTAVTTSQFAVFTILIGSSMSPEFTSLDPKADTRLRIEIDNGNGWVICEVVIIGEITRNMINTVSNYAWMLNGNTGTDASNNFLGTKDAQSLIFRTNNLERMRINDDGYVGINNNTPLSLLDVLHPSTPSEPYVQRIYSGWINDWGASRYLFTQVGFLRIDQHASNVVRYYSGYFVAEVYQNNSDNITTRIVPLQGQMDHYGTGALSTVRGIAGFINNRRSGTITDAYSGFLEMNNFSTGTISNGYILYISDGTQNGTMTNKTGITVENISGATNNTDLLIGSSSVPAGDFSIYVASNKDSYINGNLGVGISPPSRKLHVKDVMRLEPRPTSPSSPAEGDIYMDSTTHKLRVYDGTIWQDCW